MRKLLLAALVVGVLIGTTAGSSLPGPGVIRVNSETIRFGEKIGGTKNHAVRMQLSLLYNTRITPYNIGNMIVICRFLGKRGPLGTGTSFCEATYSLPRGRIQAEGLIKRRELYVLSVTGGTGLYSNVGGEVLVTTHGYGPRRERILFSLEAIV